MARIGATLEKRKADREALRLELRARCPVVTAWVDAMREEFGDLRVTYVNEGGYEKGNADA